MFYFYYRYKYLEFLLIPSNVTNSSIKKYISCNFLPLSIPIYILSLLFTATKKKYILYFCIYLPFNNIIICDRHTRRSTLERENMPVHSALRHLYHLETTLLITRECMPISITVQLRRKKYWI